MADAPLPRMPYGMAKRIIATMEVGDVYVTRPAYLVPLHNAARRLGKRIAAVCFTRDGVRLYRVLRIAEGWRSGHAVSRRPGRHQASGRWRKAA